VHDIENANNLSLTKAMTKTPDYTEKPVNLRKIMPLKRIPLLLCLATVTVWPLCASAQDPTITDTAPTSSTSSTLVPEQEMRVDTEVAKPGAAPGRAVKPGATITPSGTPFQAGSFLVYPEFDTTWFYDNNIYSTNTATVSDHAWIYSPAIWVQSNWVKHALNFHAASDYTRYETYGAEDSDDYRISGEGRYDFSADTNVYAGAHFSQDHEDRESPSAQNGLTPTKYLQRRYYGGFFRQIDKFSFRIAGTAQHLNYKDVNFITGGGAVSIINNDDRDRWQYTGGIRLAYEVSPRLEPYLQIAFDNRRYDEAIDDLGYSRDSDGQRYLAGLRMNLPQKIKLDAFAGWMKQDYSDSRLKDVSAPVAGAALQWAAGDRTTVSAYLDRTVEETTVTRTPSPGVVEVSSSFVNTYASAGVEHRFTDKLSLRLNGSVSRVAYEGLSRTDEYTGATIGGVYRLHRNLFLDMNLTERKLNSSIPTEDFSKRMIFVRVAIPFSH